MADMIQEGLITYVLCKDASSDSPDVMVAWAADQTAGCQSEWIYILFFIVW